MFSEAQSARGEEQKDEAFRHRARKLLVHETAEQEVVHPLAKSATGADSVVEERLEEESKGESVLSELERLGVGHERFDAQLEELREEVYEHAEAEEEDEHPRIDQAVGGDRLVQLAPVYRAAESAAPTHPHPHGPTSAAGNLAVGPAVAVVDRARDAIRAANGKVGS
ncbi:MAG: hemerythrin domain-containing protein [Acidimicrobiales bacterium]